MSIMRSAERAPPAARADFRRFVSVPTRWSDNDVYGHMNNVVAYSLFDTAVNGLLLEAGLIDIQRGTIVFYVVETGCRYFRSLAYPQMLEVGVSVARLGERSVTYRLGLFAAGDLSAAAEGRFVHVAVERESGRSVAIPGAMRGYFNTLLIGAGNARQD